MNERPFEERPAAKPVLPSTPESTPKQIRNAKIFGTVAGLVVVAIPIIWVASVIGGNAAEERANEEAAIAYQQEVDALKAEASEQCFNDIANWRGEPLADNREVMTFQAAMGTMKIQGVALGGQFTCIYKTGETNSQRTLDQLAWDKMDGSVPDFYIP